MEQLAARGYTCYQEPVKSWEASLVKASRDPEIFSADLQRCVIAAMTKRNKEAFYETTGGGVQIFERDVSSAIPFIHCAGEKHHISEDEKHALI